MKRGFFLVLTFLLLVSLVSLGANQTVTAAPPTGFQDTAFIINLNQPTAVAFTPDGRMLITERAGLIHVVQPGASQFDATPFLQITNINIDQGERGLVGIALDPGFATNSFYYVFYTANSPLRDRLSRFTASGNITLPGSEVVIWQDNVDAAFWHHGGTVAFGPDGKVYISIGDHFDTTSGTGHVSQRLDSYHGKILRINKDGTVPTDNPFYDGAGPNLDAIWAMGLRNPFRFSFDSQTGAMYIGDNGGNVATSIEELNKGAAGANYGWPICEGSCGVAGMTNPIFTYNHNNRDASIIAGFVYRGTIFPAMYQGNFFYADYAQNWISRLTFDASGNVTGSIFFEPTDGTLDGPYGDIVDLKIGTDGCLYYVDIGLDQAGNTHPGTVRRICYFSANNPPVINTASASPTSGPGPTLQVSFTAAATDPENTPLTYSWDFGDGTSSATQNPVHTYQAKGPYTARLTVSDGQLQTLSSPIAITVGAPPVPRITAPANGTTFRAGDVINFSGTATDSDGVLTSSSYSWTIVFHHETHIHPGAGPFSGTSGSFTIPTTGHDFSGNTSFEIILTVTDSDGLSAQTSTTIYPQKVNLTFVTNPPGLAINFDQTTNVPTPYVHDTLINFQHTIEAPLQQTFNGSNYAFVSWSDGGAALHTITVPAVNQTYTANYQLVGAVNFPTTALLDSFTRVNGPVGASWSGAPAGYSVNGNQLDVGSGGELYWNTSFGADQEAYVTLVTLDPAAAETDLLLKSQNSTTYGSGLIEVWYDVVGKRVQVWTYASSQGWVQRGADLPVTMVNGDQFGARARSNGSVEIYRNGVLLGTRDVSAWPYNANGGFAGLWMVNASNAFLDNFGAGTVSASSSTPTATPTSTSTPTSTATATRTNTPTATAAAATATATRTNTPTATRTNTPTATATTAGVPTNTPTFTSTPLNSPTATATSTSTGTPTATPRKKTAAPTPTATQTLAGVPSNTPTATATLPAQATATNTPAATNTSTSTATLLASSTPTLTPTSTSTATSTRTSTPTPTATNTPLFTSTSTPTRTNTPTFTPTSTATATAASGVFPAAGVLDNFNRTNGAPGASWLGSTGSYAIAANQLDVISSGDIYWAAASMGTNQEVYVTLATKDPGGLEQDLLLKSQSNNSWTNGLIEVMYDATSNIIQVWTYAPSQGWIQRGASIPVTFVNGDRFGARARSNGTVEVYRNATLIGSVDASAWPFNSLGGYIGIWTVNANGAIFDDFGGGTIP